MTTRRGFLGAMLALGAAPAIVRAESLMKIVVPRQELWLSEATFTNFAEELARSIRQTKEEVAGRIYEEAFLQPKKLIIPKEHILAAGQLLGVTTFVNYQFVSKDDWLLVTPRAPARFNLKGKS